MANSGQGPPHDPYGMDGHLIMQSFLAAGTNIFDDLYDTQSSSSHPRSAEYSSSHQLPPGAHQQSQLNSQRVMSHLHGGPPTNPFASVPMLYESMDNVTSSSSRNVDPRAAHFPSHSAIPLHTTAPSLSVPQADSRPSTETSTTPIRGQYYAPTENYQSSVPSRQTDALSATVAMPCTAASMPRTPDVQLMSVQSSDGMSNLTPSEFSAQSPSLSSADPNPDRREKRLARNRDAARQCRQRKKQYVSDLEEKAKRLQEEIDQLRARKQTSPGVEEARQRTVLTGALRNLMMRAATDRDVTTLMRSFMHHFHTNARERIQAIEHHITELRELLAPNQHSKLMLWTLSQDDAFYQKSASSGGLQGLWELLCQEMQLSEEQKRALLTRRSAVSQERRELANIDRVLLQLQDRVRTRLMRVSQMIDHLAEILTVKQQAKFLLWIETQQREMQVVESVWQSSIARTLREQHNKSLLHDRVPSHEGPTDIPPSFPGS
eukprot:Rmarinus@m.10244